MKFKKLVIILAISMSISGCSLIDKQMKSYLGHNIFEATSTFGAPAAVYEVGNGNTAYSFVEWNGSYYKTRTFVTDRDGRIVAYSWKGF